MAQHSVSFPVFFVSGLLKRAGWPRKRGFLRRRRVVNRVVLYATLAQLVIMGIAMGTGRPQQAAQLLGQLFRARDWVEQPAAELFRDLEITDWQEEERAWKAILRELEVPTTSSDEASWEEVIDWDNLMTYHAWFAQSLCLGLTQPTEMAVALAREREQHEHWSKIWEIHRLKLPPSGIGNNEDLFSYCEVLVLGYEDAFGKLPQIPRALAENATIAFRLMG